MKRAALIITDARFVEWFDQSSGHGCTRTAEPSEQLLADLRRVLARAVQRVDSLDPYYTASDYEAIARVRALLPEEGDEDE